jgi:hypothetical protein
LTNFLGGLDFEIAYFKNFVDKNLQQKLHHWLIVPVDVANKQRRQRFLRRTTCIEKTLKVKGHSFFMCNFSQQLVSLEILKL